ncbi:MAG: polysaccharide biosynthesis/export family protein [Rhizobiales bacterium]|nr:polysaccharide biosynthesis/export family protein [Hyphomicrobiales bacterium]
MCVFKLYFLIISTLLLSACAIVPGGEVYIGKEAEALSKKTPSITTEQIEFHKITAQNTKKTATKKHRPYRNFKLEQQVKSYSYKVGAGDVLQVTVWEHPELLNLGATGLPAIGFQIDSRGYIFYPYVGRFQVAGKSVNGVRTSLSEALSKYIENPQLDVRVTKYAAKKVYLTGQVVKPLPLTLSGQAITLLDAINQAGGVTKNANLDDVVVIRKGKRRHIDLYALMHFGDMRQNILLRDGDQIHVADQKVKYAYMMGQVRSPIAVQLPDRGVTLAEALGKAGGINELTANAKAVYVIRESHQKGMVAKVHMLDLSNMAAMVLAAKFELKNEDVVYVAKSPIVKWNQLLSVITPSLTSLNSIATTKTNLNTAF